MLALTRKTRNRGTPGVRASPDLLLDILCPRLSGEQCVCIGPDGHWRGSEKAAEHLVYVALTEEGHQLTFTPEEFAKKYGWKNDPSKARFAALGE